MYIYTQKSQLTHICTFLYTVLLYVSVLYIHQRLSHVCMYVRTYVLYIRIQSRLVLCGEMMKLMLSFRINWEYRFHSTPTLCPGRENHISKLHTLTPGTEIKILEHRKEIQSTAHTGRRYKVLYRAIHIHRKEVYIVY